MRGEKVALFGNSLYRFDSVSAATQEKAQDFLTLFIGVPLLLVGIYLASKSSARGLMLLTGMLGYFLYTYASMSFLTAYNSFFLVYVSLFSLSLFGFILAMRAINLDKINVRLSVKFPRRGLSILCILMGSLMFLMWVGGRIIMPLAAGKVPEGLETYSTLVIQVLDLGVVVPTAFLTAWLLLRRDRWGVPLAVVFTIKAAALATAVSLMAFNMALNKIAISPVELIVFPLLTCGIVYYAVRIFVSLGKPALAR